MYCATFNGTFSDEFCSRNHVKSIRSDFDAHRACGECEHGRKAHERLKTGAKKTVRQIKSERGGKSTKVIYGKNFRYKNINHSEKDRPATIMSLEEERILARLELTGEDRIIARGFDGE